MVRGHARWLAAVGIATLAVDAPHLWTPRPHPSSPEHLAAAGVDAVLERAHDDWIAALALAARTGAVDAGRVAYLGFSLGTRLGLRVGASLGTDLRAAVLGRFGTGGRLEPPSPADADAAALRDAARLRAPVLFDLPWQDEVFPRAGQLELFTAVGSAERELRVRDGAHAGAPEATVEGWRRFVERRLDVVPTA